MPRYRITGFNSSGEAVICDEQGRQVATGDLRLETYSEPEPGDMIGVDLHVVWARSSEAVEDEIGGIDWDRFPR